METNKELQLLLDPQRCAVVVWDVQKALVASIFNQQDFLGAHQKLLPAARAKNISVFFSKITPLPEKFESPARKYLAKLRARPFTFTPDGLDLAISPEPSDIVVPKNTASIFIGTNIELVLRNAGITTIIFTGIATEIGVESSARDALNRGFLPVVLSDAVSSFNQAAHLRSLENLAGMVAVMTTDELVALWQ